MRTAEEALIALGKQGAPARSRDAGTNGDTGVGTVPGADTDTAFEAWMRERQPALLRTAYLVCGDPHTAEDLVATALARVYLRWDTLREPRHVDAYARRIVVNENISLWRRPWRRREVSSDRLPDRGTEGGYDGARDAMWRALATLPPKQRAVVVLRYYEDLTEAETAAALGVSVGTVKSQHFKALAKLRAAIGEEDR